MVWLFKMNKKGVSMGIYSPSSGIGAEFVYRKLNSSRILIHAWTALKMELVWYESSWWEMHDWVIFPLALFARELHLVNVSLA